MKYDNVITEVVGNKTELADMHFNIVIIFIIHKICHKY